MLDDYTDPDYMRVNGVRVNREKYERRIRQLKRLDGTPTRVHGRLWPGRHPQVVHAATRMLCPPVARQVYPAVELRTLCGVDAVGMTERREWVQVTCKRCLRNAQYGVWATGGGR